MATLGLFGTYDPEAPRLRRLLAGWEAVGGRVISLSAPIWPRDRASLPPLLPMLWRLHTAHRRLWREREALASADAILVPYPGHFDMRLARRVGSALGKPVLLDPFISLYDTVVGDRGRVRPGSPVADVLRWLDAAALRAADRVLADTAAQAAYYAELSGLAGERFAVVPVGADERLFAPRDVPEQGTVLFYGSMIPLHGVAVIAEAARLLPEVPFHLVGTGQVDVAGLVAGLSNVRHTPWLAEAELPEAIAHASVCLGIFGASEKAQRVVPHKVYEAAAMGKAIVSADTRAMREAFGDAVRRVPSGDAAALAEALRSLLANPAERERLGAAARARFLADYTADALGRALAAAINPLPAPATARPGPR